MNSEKKYDRGAPLLYPPPLFVGGFNPTPTTGGSPHQAPDAFGLNPPTGSRVSLVSVSELGSCVANQNFDFLFKNGHNFRKYAQCSETDFLVLELIFLQQKKINNQEHNTIQTQKTSRDVGRVQVI